MIDSVSPFQVQIVVLMICLVYLVMHSVIWFALSEQRDTQVIVWSISGVLSGIAIVPLSMRGIVSEFAFFYVGQTLMVLGNAGRCLALRLFLGAIPSSAKNFYALSTVVLLVVMLGGYELGVSDYYTLTFFHLFYAVILLDYFVMGYSIRGAQRSLGCELLMAAGLGLSLTQLIRAIAVAADPQASAVYAPTIDQAIMLLGQFVCIPLSNIGFLRIFLEERERKRLQIERALAAADAQQRALSLHRDELNALLRERDEIIRQLTLSNKTAAMGALVASLAHELNQPLCAMQLNTHLIEGKLAGVPVDGIAPLIHSLKSDNHRAADIILKVRSLFEDRHGDVVELELGQLLQDCATLVRPYAKEKGVELSVDIPTFPRLVGDATQLQQVFLNLLNNAIEAAAEAGVQPKLVQVYGRRHDETIVLIVEDNGIGIPVENQHFVFELFKSTKAQGMGVGLWLSKTVINAHRGTLHFSSVPGQGTRFEVRLPLTAMEVTPMAETLGRYPTRREAGVSGEGPIQTTEI
jgi:signal transduction histidine kinase